MKQHTNPSYLYRVQEASIRFKNVESYKGDLKFGTLTPHPWLMLLLYMYWNADEHTSFKALESVSLEELKKVQLDDGTNTFVQSAEGFQFAYEHCGLLLEMHSSFPSRSIKPCLFSCYQAYKYSMEIYGFILVLLRIDCFCPILMHNSFKHSHFVENTV